MARASLSGHVLDAHFGGLNRWYVRVGKDASKVRIGGKSDKR